MGGGGGGRGPARTQVGGCRQERAPLRRRGVQRRAGRIVPAPIPGAACERRERGTHQGRPQQSPSPPSPAQKLPPPGRGLGAGAPVTGEVAGAGPTNAGGSSPASGVRARPLVKGRLRERLAAKRRRPREFGGDGRLARRWRLAAAGRPRAEARTAGAACRRLRGSLHPAGRQRRTGSGAAGCRLPKGGRAPNEAGRRQGDSPGVGGTGLGLPLSPPGGRAVRLFWLPAASGGRGDPAPTAVEKCRGSAGADRGCRRKMVLLGKQHPPLPPLSPARAVCSALIARRGHPAPAAPPSRDGYIQRLLSRNFPGTASCDRTRSGASAAIAASRGRRTEPPPLSRRGSGRRTLPRGPPASSSGRGAAGDAQVVAGDVADRSRHGRREHELSSGTCDSRDLLQESQLRHL
ncbi:collagen alpha-2(I) chain-like [Corvus kubaryi]|uniref:collagen alpha-2(I) chain-like n=1 Tax=Corvus kubaryi TaxID=68294 RepID=UPI001C03F6E9|nr:collagen alpha-2(I) chain-like [Corvus kubaryi]